MVVLDSFPFADVQLIQDKVNPSPSRNESPRSEITIGSSTDSAEEMAGSAEEVAESAEDTSEPAPSASPFLRCEKCHYQTKIESLLHKHIAKHFLDSDFLCPVCDFHESNSSLFVDHYATHYNGLRLKCPLCHKKLFKRDLKAHIVIHKAVTLYDCSMCEFSTNHVKSIKGHTEAFHVKVYKCRQCSLGLTKHELQLHMKSAHDSEHSPPELADKSVEDVSSSSRKTAEVSAATSETKFSGNPGEAPFSCSLCDFSTRYPQTLTRHTEAWHTKEYQCTKCTQVMKKHDLVQHMKTLHALHDSNTNANQNPPGISSNPSQVSGVEAPKPIRRSLRTTKGLRSNPTQGSVKGALNTATTETLQTTEQDQKSSLAYSQSSGKLPYCCSLCDYSTKNTHHFKRHKEAWHEKKCQCKQCGQVMSKHDRRLHTHGSQGSSSNPSLDSGKDVPTSTTKSSLGPSKNDAESSLAYRQGSDKLPHSCPLCEYSSTFIGNFKRHTEAWHEKKYQCDQCGQVMSKHDLRLHMDASHGVQGSTSTPSQDSGKDAPKSSTKSSLGLTKNDPNSLPTNAQSSSKLPHCCPFCEYSSMNIGNFKRHTEVMHEKKYPCKECGQVMSKHDLRLHMDTPHGLQGSSSNPSQDSREDAPKSATMNSLSAYNNDSKSSPTQTQSLDKILYCCPMCDYSSSNESNLNRHTDSWHRKGHRCKECNQVMFKHELQLHMVASHGVLASGSNLNEVPGEGAPKSLTTNSLKNDPKSPSATSQSSDNVPYCCPVCKFSSTNKGFYIRHTEAWHDTEHLCVECGQVMSKYNLLLHMEASHGSHGSSTKPTVNPATICQQTTKNTPEALQHDHAYVRTSGSLQMSSSAAGASVEIQSLKILENSRKSLPESQGKPHPGCSQTTSLELEPFSFHEFSSKFSQDLVNTTGDAKSTRHQQHSDDVISSSCNTSTNERHSQQMEPNRRKCEFCRVTYSLSYFKKHVRRCAAPLIPDGVEDELTDKAPKNIPKTPVAETLRVASGIDLLRPGSFGAGKWRVVLKRLNSGSSKLNYKEKYAINSELRVLIKKERFGLASRKITKKPMLHCSECVFRTKKRELLKKHVAKHLMDLRLECPYCGHKEMSGSIFVRHIAEHQGDTHTFRCCFCESRTFGYRHTLGQHLQKHRPESLLDCPKCEFSAFRSDKLRCHVRDTHEKKYRCRECGATMNRFLLGKHMCKPHGRAVEQPVENQVLNDPCPESAENTLDLLSAHDADLDQAKDLEHQPFAHPKKVKQVSQITAFEHSVAKGSNSTPGCDALAENVIVDILAGEHDLIGPSPSKSVQHIKPKESLLKLVKPYFRCSKCSYKTRIKSLLKQHVAKHLIDDGFTCTICDFKESCSRKFARHWFSHNKGSGQMIECCFCPAQYRKQSCLKGSLPTHVERHRVVKLFDCSKCEFSGSDRYALERHHQKHHSERYRFEVCRKRMTLKRLSKHAFALQPTPLRLEKSSRSEQVFDRPRTLEQFENGSCAMNPTGSNHILEIKENHPTPSTSDRPNVLEIVPKVYAGCKFAKPSHPLPSGQLDVPACTEGSVDVTFDQTDTTTRLAMPCDIDNEYCLVCKRWVSLDDFAIHQQQCLNTTVTTNVASTGTQHRSLSIAHHGKPTELPMKSDDLSSSPYNLGFNVAYPTNPEFSMNFDKDVELTTRSDATNAVSNIQFASKSSSGNAVISVSSDSEDSYGSQYCDSELVGEANPAPALDYKNAIQDRVKNLLKFPDTDDILSLCQSMNSENPIRSEKTHEGKHQLVDSTRGIDNLAPDVRNMSVLQGRDTRIHSDMPEEHSGFSGQLEWGNFPIKVTINRPETLSLASGAADKATAEVVDKATAEVVDKATAEVPGKATAEGAGKAIEERTFKATSGAAGKISTRQSLRRSDRSSRPYPEISFPPSGSDGRVQRSVSTSQTSSDTSRDVPVWRYADGRFFISRYLRNSANNDNLPSTSD